jgi:hypothetical protein
MLGFDELRNRTQHHIDYKNRFQRELCTNQPPACLPATSLWTSTQLKSFFQPTNTNILILHSSILSLPLPVDGVTVVFLLSVANLDLAKCHQRYRFCSLAIVEAILLLCPLQLLVRQSFCSLVTLSSWILFAVACYGYSVLLDAPVGVACVLQRPCPLLLPSISYLQLLVAPVATLHYNTRTILHNICKRKTTWNITSFTVNCSRQSRIRNVRTRRITGTCRLPMIRPYQ